MQWYMHLRQLGQLVEKANEYARRQYRVRQEKPPTSWNPDGGSAIDLHANFGIGGGVSVVDKEARMNAALAVGGVFMCPDRMMRLLCMQGYCPASETCTDCELASRLLQIDGILSGFGVFAEPAIGHICTECTFPCGLAAQAPDGTRLSSCHNMPVDVNMVRKRMLDIRLANLNAAAVAMTGHIILRRMDASGREVIEPVRRATVGEVANMLGVPLPSDDPLINRAAVPDRMFWPLTAITVLMGAVHYPHFASWCQSGPGAIPSRWAAFKSVETKLDSLCCSLSPGDGNVAVGGASAVWQTLSYVCSDAVAAYKSCVVDGMHDARLLVATYPNLFPPKPVETPVDDVQGGAGARRRRVRRRT